MTPDTATVRTAIVAGLVAAIVSIATVGLFLFARGGIDGVAVSGPAAADKAAIEATVRNYLLGHPEVLVEMSSVLEQRQAEAQETALRSAIAQNAGALYRSSSAFVAGNPKGDVTVVEFFDYNCGYCKRALPDVVKLIEKDDKVRVVFMELPILRRESEGAARVALASMKQGKYFEVHQALLAAKGMASEESGLKIAADLGLDVEKLKQDMNAPDVDQAIKEARTLANDIGVQGTPFYLVGDRVVPGAPADLYEQLTAKVAEIRKDGCNPTVSC